MCNQVQNSNTELLIAIIGIIGTLLGTVLGWILNNLSQHGKLNVYVTEWEEKFTHIGEYGAFETSRKKEEAKSFSYNFSLDLYNSSGTTKIMRNIKVVLLGNNKELSVDIPQDIETARSSRYMITYDNVEPINVSPKTVETLKLKGYFSDDSKTLDFAWLAEKVELRYTNEKNQEKVIPIKKVDYNKYFEKFTVEDKANG